MTLEERNRSRWAWFKRAYEPIDALDGLGLIAGLILGLVALGQITAAWALHWLQSGHWFYALVITCALLMLLIAGALRVPLAMLLLFGGGTAVSAFYWAGHAGLLLP